MEDNKSKEDKNNSVEGNNKKNVNSKKDLDLKKKQMTLDLISDSKSKKKAFINHLSNNCLSNSTNTFPEINNSIWTPSSFSNCLLESPDIKKLNLPTPDLEKFIINNTNFNLTPTPSLPKEFAFELLGKMRTKNDNVNTNDVIFIDNSNSDSLERSPSTISSNYYTMNYQSSTNDDNSNGLSMISGNNSNCSFNINSNTNINNINNSKNQKFENSNLNLNSIDMKDQEQIKLERKRDRNRIAASKCRKRKLERIAHLEDRVKQLKFENSGLSQEVLDFKEKVYLLKQELLSHLKNGCNINSQYKLRD